MFISSFATITSQRQSLVPLCSRTDCSTCYLRCISNNLLRIFFLLVVVGETLPQASFWLIIGLTDQIVHILMTQWSCPPFTTGLKKYMQGPKLAAQKLDLASEISRPWYKALLGGHLVNVTRTALALFKDWGSLQERWWETTLTWTIL